MKSVRFAAVEAGVKLLRTTLRQALFADGTPHPPAGRIRVSSVEGVDPVAAAQQSGFLRLVSVAEASLDSLSVELTEENVDSIDEVVRRLMLEKELAVSSGWDAKRRSFKRHHGVDLRKCDEYKRVEGAIEVRNAIAHGLGRLTTKQQMSVECPKKLAAINVLVVNGAVDIGSGHLEECARYLTEFLRAVDSKVHVRAR